MFQYPQRVDLRWNAMSADDINKLLEGFNTLNGSIYVGTVLHFALKRGSHMFQYPQRVDLRWNPLSYKPQGGAEAVSIPSTGRFTLELCPCIQRALKRVGFQYPQRVDLRWNR